MERLGANTSESKELPCRVNIKPYVPFIRLVSVKFSVCCAVSGSRDNRLLCIIRVTFLTRGTFARASIMLMDGSVSSDDDVVEELGF